MISYRKLEVEEYQDIGKKSIWETISFDHQATMTPDCTAHYLHFEWWMGPGTAARRLRLRMTRRSRCARSRGRWCSPPLAAHDLVGARERAWQISGHLLLGLAASDGGRGRGRGSETISRAPPPTDQRGRDSAAAVATRRESSVFLMRKPPSVQRSPIASHTHQTDTRTDGHKLTRLTLHGQLLFWSGQSPDWAPRPNVWART